MKYARGSKEAIANKIAKIIYVEGQDDAWFIDEILTELQANPEEVGIVYTNGNGEFDKKISLLLKSSSYVQRFTKTVAIFMDADTDIEKTKEWMAKVLTGKGLPSPDHAQFIQYDNDRNFGLFYFPDGNSAGEIEDLLLYTVREDQRLAIVSSAFDEIDTVYGPLPKRTKRIARMYGSVLPVKPCGMGRAYCEGIFPKDHPSIEVVRSFVRELIS